MSKHPSYYHHIDAALYYKPHGDHGVMHTYRVMRLANELLKYYDLTFLEHRLLMCACCYHDIGRTHDYEDCEHGRDSVIDCIDKQLFHKFHLTPEEIEIAKLLIIYHAIPDSQFSTNNERIQLLYNIIKDADAIDRLRFNDLDESFLRLPESHSIIGLELQLLKELPLQ